MAPSASDAIASPTPTTSASSPAYVRQKPGTYPPPPDKQNTCYAAGAKTAPLPCLDVHDPLLPMLIGQCLHPASNIQDGPVLAQYSGSPAVLCCYQADTPNCSGRPLLIAGIARVAALMKGRGWSGSLG